MVLIVLAMFVILFVAAAVAGVVVLGIEGRGRSRAPQLADHCATAAHHLNGEAQPPVRLTEVVHRYVASALEQRSHAR
jgi:negative regulator of sigma E activity